MNFIEMESPEKLRGGYYTQPEVAAFLTRWVLEIRHSAFWNQLAGTESSSAPSPRAVQRT